MFLCFSPGQDPGALEPCKPGALEPWNPANLEPWSPGTLEPWNPGTLEPWSPGTLEPWNPGTLEPWNPGTLEPWSPGTLEPWNPGSVALQWSARLHSKKLLYFIPVYGFGHNTHIRFIGDLRCSVCVCVCVCACVCILGCIPTFPAPAPPHDPDQEVNRTHDFVILHKQHSCTEKSLSDQTNVHSPFTCLKISAQTPHRRRNSFILNN